MVVIYGVDTSKPYQAADVRDALVECFTQAHKEQLDALREFTTKDITDDEFENIKRIDVRQMIRSTMKDLGGNFDSPTKPLLEQTVLKLMEFASNFRDKTIVEKHSGEIKQLLDGLK